MRIVVDTSVIINGQLTTQIKLGLVNNTEIIIAQAVFDELQAQAAKKRDQGIAGLEEIKEIQMLSNEFNNNVILKGEHPTSEDIKLSSSGRIDAIIINLAKQNNATLYTSDKIQHLVAQAEGVESTFLKNDTELEFLKYFDSDTMSVHLKENQPPLAKKGKPGAFKLTRLDDTPLSTKYMKNIASQILEKSDDITDMSGASIIQYDNYRISITRPPFSDKFEITIVHPIVKRDITEYNIPDKLMDRFLDDSRGVIISGSPGSGKSTLASSIANFYNSMGKIVKTFESPRDLQVEAGITQYTKLNGSFANTADILLLVRPDQTIFDEVRRREDFGIFSDLRLAGVGMIGVIHASAPLDSIQRFIGKIELGMIPNVLDTVIFVKSGEINKIYDLTLCVKVPTGMTESDLARPVIEIRDFTNNTLEYEIYTFGEENVIVPVSNEKKRGVIKLAEERIYDEFKRYEPTVEAISDSRFKVVVDERYIPSIIGRGGSNINKMEKHLGVHIDVVARDSESPHSLPFTISESKRSLLFSVGREYATMHAEIYVNGKYLTLGKISRKGQIKTPKYSDIDLVSSKSEIKIILKNS